MTRAIGGDETGLEDEVVSVAILTIAWEKVERQVTNKSASLAFFVPDSRNVHIGVPSNVLPLAALEMTLRSSHSVLTKTRPNAPRRSSAYPEWLTPEESTLIRVVCPDAISS